MQDTGPLNFIWLGVTENNSTYNTIKNTHTHTHFGINLTKEVKDHVEKTRKKTLMKETEEDTNNGKMYCDHV